MTKPAYKRVLLKLSGEALMGDDAFGINRATIERMVADVAEVSRLGVELAIVIGGGNIFRGVAPGAQGMDRATADYMGMLATVMNSLALSDALRQVGVTSRVMSAIGIDQVVEPYVRPKALQYLEEGKVVVFAAGTGNPFFTTDTAAALRGSEVGAEIVLFIFHVVAEIADHDRASVDVVSSARHMRTKGASAADGERPGGRNGMVSGAVLAPVLGAAVGVLPQHQCLCARYMHAPSSCVTRCAARSP